MKSILHALFVFTVAALASFLAGGCASSTVGTGDFAPSGGYRAEADGERSASAPGSRTKSRPGLATAAGQEQYSSIRMDHFHRKAGNQPDAIDSFHYNDEDGVKTMAGALGGGRRHGGLFPVAGGRIKAGLCQGYSGSEFPHIEADGHHIVIGESGSAYGIRVKNVTKKRIEIVASVDGLDVLDGKAASVKKGGYVLDAGDEYTIEGFRKNNSQVRQFRFGSVSDSEAAKQGQARNVGVVGLAVYEEDESAAKAARLNEALQRAGASAFPRSR